MKQFNLGTNIQVKDIFNLDNFVKDLDDSLFRATNKFANEEVLPITRKDTGTLADSMDVIKTNTCEAVIYFDDNKCPYTVEAHELPDWYRVTTPGTMSKFLERPILEKGNQIFETVEQVMRVKGWK